MSETRRMFSESWHRVAGLRAALDPAVEVYQQHFRGERWYVLRDPLNNDFYRVGTDAWEFVGRLDGKRSIEEVWRECVALAPDTAPGQEEVIQLLAQLHRANLFQSPLPADSARIFEHYRKSRARRLRGQIVNFLFVHVPIFDPDRLLDALRPLARLAFGPLGALAWVLVVGLALKTTAEHFDAAMREARTLFDPDNLLLFYFSTVFVKFFHEFGHGLACKRFGGEVHTFGLMFMVLVPLPYLDVTSTWSFRHRYQRVLVGCAGMIAEFFVAGLAALVWARTGDPLLHTVTFQMMFIASVSTLIFNANPLLRFDGYYIFSDLMDLPNLYQRATRQLKHIGERYLFGVRASFSPARDRRERAWLIGYGATSTVYRVALIGLITFTVAEGFLGLGLALAVVAIAIYFVLPLAKFVRYLATGERLTRNRGRAVAVTVLIAAALVAALGLYPYPRHFRAPGVVQARGYAQVNSATEGYLEEIAVPSGAEVHRGDVLVRMRNPELDIQAAAGRARLQQIAAQVGDARRQGMNAVLAALASERRATRLMLGELSRRHAALVVRADRDGFWSSPRAREMVGSWVPIGAPLGEIVDPAALDFVAAVDQNHAGNLFNGAVRGATVRLRGQAALPVRVSAQRFVPAQTDVLPSAALGQPAGGPVKLRRGDRSGRRAAESFYRVRAELVPRPGVRLLHDRRGEIRFTLDPEPLARQWWRILRQTLQRRLQL